jgi:hypothetical protein
VPKNLCAFAMIALCFPYPCQPIRAGLRTLPHIWRPGSGQFESGTTGPDRSANSDL